MPIANFMCFLNWRFHIFKIFNFNMIFRFFRTVNHHEWSLLTYYISLFYISYFYFIFGLSGMEMVCLAVSTKRKKQTVCEMNSSSCNMRSAGENTNKMKRKCYEQGEYNHDDSCEQDIIHLKYQEMINTFQ